MMRTARAAPLLPPSRSSSATSKGSLDSNGNRKFGTGNNRKIKASNSGSKMKLSKFFKVTSSSKLGDDDQSQTTNNTTATSNSKSSKSYVPGGSVRSRSDGSKRGSLLGKQTSSFNDSIRSGLSLMSDMSGSTMSTSSRRSSTSSGSGGRSSKKRNQVISQFVSNGTSKSQVKGLWGDNGSGEATDIVDTTSEESNGSSSPTYEHKRLVDHDDSVSSPNDESYTALNSSFASYGEQQPILEEMPPLPLPPLKKSVRFATPLVAMCVEVESSWMIWGCGRQMAQWTQEYKDQQLREKGRTKATLLDGSHLWIGKEAMAAYNPQELLESQPVAPKFLSTLELKAVRHQKERLCKYRRKLKKKLRARRQQRCELQKKLAEMAIVKYQERHTRIINRYKMAAPNAVEHRRRRQIKFALAAQAKTVWLVQQRQRHLLGIRRTAEARLQRIRDQQSRMNIGLPHYHIRHQMKRIMVHQASTAGLMRLQRNQSEVEEVDGQPVAYSIDQPGVPPHDTLLEEDGSDSDVSDSEDDDDDDLDVEDINFRRLEVAVVSFLASAKSKRFGNAAAAAARSQEDDSDDEEDESHLTLGGTSVEI